MTTIEVSRRAFIGGASAAAVVVALPVPVAALERAPEVVEAPLKWCFSSDPFDELFDIGYPTRQAAIEAGFGYHGDEPFEIGTYEPHLASVPDGLHETVANALADGDSGIIDVVTAIHMRISDWNEDCDFNGEFVDDLAVAGTKDREFDMACLAAVKAAIIRHGFPDVAHQVEAKKLANEVPETLVLALEADRQLDHDLHAAVHAFMDRHSLWTAGNRITLSNHETFYPKVAIERDHGEGC